MALRRLQRIVEPRAEPLPRPRSRRLKRPKEPRSRDAVDRGVSAAVEDKLLVAVDNVGGHGVLVGFVAQLQLGGADLEHLQCNARRHTGRQFESM